MCSIVCACKAIVCYVLEMVLMSYVYILWIHTDPGFFYMGLCLISGC